MRKVLSVLLLFVITFLLSLPADAAEAAEQVDGKRSIRVMGRKKSVVSTREVTLADIAEVSSKYLRDDEAIVALKGIKIIDSPSPGKSLTLPANAILERLREEGVELKEVGYSIPRVMTISRAARAISSNEIQTAIKAALSASNDEALEFLNMSYKEPVKIAPGVMRLQAKLSPGRRPGKYRADIEARVEGEAPARFSVPFEVREWANIPVARRALPRGVVIKEQDLVMARIDLSELAGDVAKSAEQIVGQETKRSIGYGESFAKKKLAIPPVIEQGAQVKLIYKTRLLEATASGVALEAGIEGQQIKIRNANSRRTIVGTVVEPGLVKVNR